MLMAAILHHLAIRSPNPCGLLSDFVHISACRDAERELRGEVQGRFGKLVSHFKKKPVPLARIAPFAAFSDEHPSALHFFTVQNELQTAVSISLLSVADWLPSTLIPQKNGPAPIFPLRD